MNINLNNYESFFLMYVDNELSASEKKSVEAFLQQYPYLKEELDLLQEVVLPANDAVIFDKNNLYKTALTQNTVEAMLLHMDNELEGEAKEKLVKQIDSDNTAKLEWALLQKTKLDGSDIISFHDKAILYRTEGSKIITGRFVKWAVAAALIAAGFFVAVSITKNQQTVPGGLSKTEERKNKDTGYAVIEKTVLLPDESTSKEAPQHQLQQQVFEKTSKTARVIANTKDAKTRSSNLKNSIQKQNEIAKNTEALANNKTMNASEKAVENQQSIVLNNKNSNIQLQAPELNTTKNMTAVVLSATKPAIIDRDIAASKNEFARNAAMDLTEEKSDDYILFMNEEDISRSKAGVFFKKLKRTVARSTNIKSGSSLRIAGFEFAVK